MKTGKFITLEGSEGAGKSTNLAFIEDLLKHHGKEVMVTREPGGTEIGEDIRTILLDKNHTAMQAETELLLMFAARAQHLQEKILPALEKGVWVVSDRFTDASYAYQGAARDMGFERIAPIEQWVQQGFQPDCTLLLDLPVEIGMQRVGARAQQTDRFENEQQSFFEKVRQAYLMRAAQAPQRYHVIDAANELAVVQSHIIRALQPLLDHP